MNVSYQIDTFDSRSPAPAETLAFLHRALLPKSPLVRLGQRFLKRFYYRKLPAGGLIFGAVATVNDAPAGFIVATEDSLGFMNTAIRRYWPALICESALSVLTSREVLRALPETCGLLKARASENAETKGVRSETSAGRVPVSMPQRCGEILSFGVLPEFQTPAFLRDARVNIADDLLTIAMQRMDQAGILNVRAVVDADNRPAMFFYNCRGWVLKKVTDSGWSRDVVEFLHTTEPIPAVGAVKTSTAASGKFQHVSA